jgi:hypothetical protein
MRLYDFATRQTGKTPYKIVARFVQDRDDWLAVLHVIGEISFGVIGGHSYSVVGRCSYQKWPEFVVLGSDPIRYFVGWTSKLVFWAASIPENPIGFCCCLPQL